MVHIWDTFNPRFCCPCLDQVHKPEHVIFTISLMNFYRKSSLILADWQTGWLPPKDLLPWNCYCTPCSFFFFWNGVPRNHRESRCSQQPETWSSNVALQTLNCRSVSREYTIGSGNKKSLGHSVLYWSGAAFSILQRHNPIQTQAQTLYAKVGSECLVIHLTNAHSHLSINQPQPCPGATPPWQARSPFVAQRVPRGRRWRWRSPHPGGRGGSKQRQ